MLLLSSIDVTPSILFLKERTAALDLYRLEIQRSLAAGRSEGASQRVSEVNRAVLDPSIRGAFARPGDVISRALALIPARR